MKKILTLLLFGLTQQLVFAQTYTAGIVGLQGTYVSHCEVNTCSGTFVDDGGAAGNYSLNINNIYRTFCPSTPGQCLTITFNTFSIEPSGFFGCYDMLTIVDSPTQNGPILGSGCGTSLQGMSFTSNNPSGCISVRFISDNITTGAGWSATISCGGCGAGASGGPTAGTNTDCINAQFVCDAGTPIASTSQGPGLTSDACVAGCVLAENYSNWYIVNVTTAGLMGLTINPNPNAADYDFALFGPVVGGCGALGAPIRCSYAANTGNTGMLTGSGDNSEDVTGNGWVESANLAVGTYYLLINQWDDYPGATFQLDFTGTAVVGLPAPSPVTANPVTCLNSVLQLNGPAISGATYNWTGPGGFTSNLQNPTRNPVVAGTYTLTYTVNGCTSPGTNVVVTIPVDVTPPTITCPGNQTLNLGAACNVAIPNYTGLAVTADNCGVASVTQSPVAGTLLSGAGVTVVTLTVTDLSGNTANCNFNVTRLDVTAPTITCPANQTVNLGPACTVALPNYTASATTADNCGVASVTQSPVAGTVLAGVGVTVVTLTVTDINGNTNTCNFNVTRADVTAPTITCPANQTINLGAGCNVALPNYTGAATTADNCGVASVTQSPVAGTNLVGTGVTVVTLTVTDINGNTNTCNFNVTRADVTAPTITCPANQTVNLGAACTVALPNYTGSATTADNCGVASVTQSPVAGTVLAGTGVTVVTLTVTDINGNTNTCNFNVTRADVTAPTITCPANQTINLGAACTVALPNYTGSATTADNCGVASVTQSPVAGTVLAGTGVTVVTLTVTDNSGNISTCNFNVTRADVTAPTITCPANQTVNLGAACTVALPNYTGSAITADNCGVASVTQSPVAGTVLSGTGVTVVTLTVTDNSGNISTCNFNVTRADVTAPTITCPANQTLNLNATCNAVLPNYTASATTADNCGVASVTQSPIAGTNLSGTGVTVVTLTVTDINGNTNTCNFNVNRVDVTAPSITCPGNQSATANASCQFVMTDYTAMATTSDNCSAVTVTQSPLAGATVAGTQVVTLTATDASGNTSNCTFQVIVTDNTPPTISCPANQTGNVGASCLFSIPNYTGLATAADNCTATPTITQSPVAGTVVGVGTTIITLTATDANGNVSTPCTFNVIVSDNTPPVVTCPAAQTLNLDASCNGVLANYVPFVTVSDNCAISSVTQSPAAGTAVSGIGATVITITATDVNGNTSNCTFNVNRVDVTPPTITCPANQTAIANASCQFTMADYTSLATTSDNCSAVTVTQSPAIGATVSGTQIVTLTATDASGNTSNCTFQVVVSDNTPPIISGCPANTTGTVNASCLYTIPNFTGSVTATDNCTAPGTLTITQSPVAGSTVGIGTTTVTITVQDANGNLSTCTLDIVVSDNTAPVLTCPSNQTLVVDNSCSATLIDYTSLATAVDNCGGAVTVTQSPAAGLVVNGSGTVTTVTLTATDNVGNSSTCTFDVTTIDTTDPIFVTCPGNQNEAPDVNCQFTLTDYTSLATVSDNCDAPATITITQSPIAGTVITGTTTITLTATDGSGNSVTCTFDVVLNDTTDPTITNCPATLNVIADNACSFTLADYTSSVTVNDNCGGSSSVTVTQSPVSGTSIGAGTTTVTLTATDGSGNTATCTFDITVADTISPVVNCVSDITTCNPIVTYTIPTATDNCGGATITQTDVTGLTSGSTFPVGTTTLQYTSIDLSGNTTVCSFDITVEPQPDASVVGADVVLCDTVTSVALSANTPTNGTGSWVLLSGSGTFGNPLSPNTTLNNIAVGTTQVAWVISSGSCVPSSDDLTITMTTCFDIIIPTGFTPDGDGTNDVWEIQYLNLYYPNCHVEVFNRWGGKLFESDGYATPWDGTFKGEIMPVSSYYFVIDFGDGSDKIKGTVTIIK